MKVISFPTMSSDITDRISDLPNDILNQILCLLSSRDVMTLSILSKRWREVCSSLLYLNLNLREHGWLLMHFPDEASLKKFVSAVLCHYDNSHLNMFRCVCQNIFIKHFAPTFITEVIKFSPRIIYLNVPISYAYAYSFSSIFTCKSVEELHLKMGRGKRGNIAKLEVVTLLSLKKLCLSNLSIWGETFNKVLSGCPVIEDLSIKNCLMSGSGIISSTTLKFLSWERWIYLYLRISAPNLVSLEFSSSSLQTTLMNLSSLVFAHVNHSYPNGCNTAGLSAVQHLDLSGTGLKTVLDEELTMLPRFDNLKCLSLNGWCMACHSGPVAWFLENSPNLKKLTVWLNMQHCLVRKKRNHHNLRQIEAPRCQKLKKLVIRVSKGYKRAYGSGMAFLKVAEEIEISEIVLCNRVWIRNGFFKKL